MGDVRAALEVLKAQLEVENVPNDIDSLHKFCNKEEEDFIDSDGKFIWIDGEAFMNFGVHKGKSLRKVYEENLDYFNWILSKDFSPEVKKIAEDALNNKFPKPSDS